MTAEKLIRNEPGRRITPGTEELGQRRGGRVEPAELLDSQLVRPPACKQAGVRRERPGGRRSGALEPNSLIRQALEVGSRVAGIAIKAEVIGPDRIQHDQQDISSLARRLRSMVSGADVERAFPRQAKRPRARSG